MTALTVMEREYMKNNVEKAEYITRKIIDDIKGRRGIGDEFEQIDEDIQREIFKKWVKIVLEGMV